MAFIRAGELRHRIAIEQPPDNLIDAAGQPVYEPSESKMVWAEITQLKGDEKRGADQIENIATVQVVTRYRTDINSKTRFRYRGAVLEVVWTGDMDGDRVMTTSICRELR